MHIFFVQGTIAAAANENNKAEKNVAVKNNAPFRSCISKINSTLIHNAEDLDIVMLIHNLLEYSQYYSMTSGNLWNYYRDESNTVDDASDGQSFKYKMKIVGKTPAQPDRPPIAAVPTLNVEITFPIKYLSNF